MDTYKLREASEKRKGLANILLLNFQLLVL
jgi:hypothetical protein